MLGDFPKRGISSRIKTWSKVRSPPKKPLSKHIITFLSHSAMGKSGTHDLNFIVHYE